MGEKAVQALTPNPHPPNLGFGTVIKEIWAQFSRKFIWLLIISSRIATKCNFKYFTSILALCFHSPKRSVQSVSMSGFWLRPPTPLITPNMLTLHLNAPLVQSNKSYWSSQTKFHHFHLNFPGRIIMTSGGSSLKVGLVSEIWSYSRSVGNF